VKEANHVQVALLTTFAVTTKEPLAVLLERIHAAFLASGLGEPSILFPFSDPPAARQSSSRVTSATCGRMRSFRAVSASISRRSRAASAITRAGLSEA
jgi:hypothetical protein